MITSLSVTCQQTPDLIYFNFHNGFTLETLTVVFNTYSEVISVRTKPTFLLFLQHFSYYCGSVLSPPKPPLGNTTNWVRLPVLIT